MQETLIHELIHVWGRDSHGTRFLNKMHEINQMGKSDPEGLQITLRHTFKDEVKRQ
jgi:hypothetical protein